MAKQKIAKRVRNIDRKKEKLRPYTFPPGMAGEIAKFIYAQAPRQVTEIAIAGAIGLLAGIAGRSYNISGTGLNQYILLLAPTGTGKESMAAGCEKLMSAVIDRVPDAERFIGPGHIMSPNMAISYMKARSPSIVCLIGEFGMYLQQVLKQNSPSKVAGVRMFLLDAYNKSGEGCAMRQSNYFDGKTAGGQQSILSPAFSLLGESTPERFYNILSKALIAEGFLPRFTLIEYDGARPKANHAHHSVRPSAALVDWMVALSEHSLMLNGQNKAVHVAMTEQAQKILNDFDALADRNISEAKGDVRRHLWNRAHIKALKLAALLAVGCDMYAPEITEEIADWAINVIINDVVRISGKFSDDEDDKQLREEIQMQKLRASIARYLSSPWASVKGYMDSRHRGFHEAGIVTWVYLLRFNATVAAFNNDPKGRGYAMRTVLRRMAASGEIAEIPKSEMFLKYQSSVLAYRVLNREAFVGKKGAA